MIEFLGTARQLLLFFAVWAAVLAVASPMLAFVAHRTRPDLFAGQDSETHAQTATIFAITSALMCAFCWLVCMWVLVIVRLVGFGLGVLRDLVG